MTHHQIGYDDGQCGNEVLLDHLQQAFKVDNEMHLQIVEETQKMEVKSNRQYIFFYFLLCLTKFFVVLQGPGYAFKC